MRAEILLDLMRGPAKPRYIGTAQLGDARIWPYLRERHRLPIRVHQRLRQELRIERVG